MTAMGPLYNEPFLTREHIVRFEVNSRPCGLKNNPKCSLCIFIELRLSVLKLVAKKRIDQFLQAKPQHSFSRNFNTALLTKTSLTPIIPEKVFPTYQSQINRLTQIARNLKTLIALFCSNLECNIIEEITAEDGEIDFHLHLEGDSLQKIEEVEAFCKEKKIELFLGNLPDSD